MLSFLTIDESVELRALSPPQNPKHQYSMSCEVASSGVHHRNTGDRSRNKKYTLYLQKQKDEKAIVNKNFTNRYLHRTTTQSTASTTTTTIDTAKSGSSKEESAEAEEVSPVITAGQRKAFMVELAQTKLQGNDERRDDCISNILSSDDDPDCTITTDLRENIDSRHDHDNTRTDKDTSPRNYGNRRAYFDGLYRARAAETKMKLQQKVKQQALNDSIESEQDLEPTNPVIAKLRTRLSDYKTGHAIFDKDSSSVANNAIPIRWDTDSVDQKNLEINERLSSRFANVKTHLETGDIVEQRNLELNERRSSRLANIKKQTAATTTTTTVEQRNLDLNERLSSRLEKNRRSALLLARQQAIVPDQKKPTNHQAHNKHQQAPTKRVTVAEEISAPLHPKGKKLPILVERPALEEGISSSWSASLVHILEKGLFGDVWSNVFPVTSIQIDADDTSDDELSTVTNGSRLLRHASK